MWATVLWLFAASNYNAGIRMRLSKYSRNVVLLGFGRDIAVVAGDCDIDPFLKEFLRVLLSCSILKRGDISATNSFKLTT